MEQAIRLTTPIAPEVRESLKAGDKVLLTGEIYVARDAAHKRMMETLERGEKLPFDLRDQVIYYMGPSPAPEGYVIGSAGPTTSHRMDAYTPKLLDLGLGGMIGKGNRAQTVVDAMVKNRSVYFAAIGGLGALLADCIITNEILSYPDLGAEALRRLTVVDFPVTVVIDASGENLYQTQRKAYEGRWSSSLNKEEIVDENGN